MLQVRTPRHRCSVASCWQRCCTRARCTKRMLLTAASGWLRCLSSSRWRSVSHVICAVQNSVQLGLHKLVHVPGLHFTIELAAQPALQFWHCKQAGFTLAAAGVLAFLLKLAGCTGEKIKSPFSFVTRSPAKTHFRGAHTSRTLLVSNFAICDAAAQALGLATVRHFARLMPLLLPWCSQSLSPLLPILSVLQRQLLLLPLNGCSLCSKWLLTMQALGLATVRHFARLMPLLLPWCWSHVGETRLLALQALDQLLRSCWARVPAHSGMHLPKIAICMRPSRLK